MHKTIVLIFILSINSIISFGQGTTLLKTWVNERNEVLIIEDSSLYFEESNMSREYDYKVSGDTLFMIEYLYTTPKQYPSFFDYRIKKLTADTLILEYNKMWLGERTKEIEYLLFIDSSKIKSEVTGFTKFLYQITYPSSTLVLKKLEVNANGDVYFLDMRDSSDIYHIRISKSSLDTLSQLLINSRIENYDSVCWGAGMHGQYLKFTVVNADQMLRRCTNWMPDHLKGELTTYLYLLSKRMKIDGVKEDKYVFLE